MSELYIGLMSGTSADGIDAVAVDLSHPLKMIATDYAPYPPSLRKKILGLCQIGENEINRLGELDVLLGHEFAKAVNRLLENAKLSADKIKAIGSHGQTIRHHPNAFFTLQVGDPNIIAAKTGITTVCDFRRKDLALGGQGAPLVPAFHHAYFSSESIDRAIVNIGGIANVSLLHPHQVIGFDTGPGNVLMDAWIYLHHQHTHDVGGAWGAKGELNTALLNQLLSDPYFSLPPPKSTGREYFNLEWLKKQLQLFKDIPPVDVQRTLAELTAQSILNALGTFSGEIVICGGGAHNTLLMKRLQTLAARGNRVLSTEEYGIHPDWVEAVAFAWLAKQTLAQASGNIPSVTGASREAILGGIYYA